MCPSWPDSGLWSKPVSQFTWHLGIFWSLYRLLGPGRPDASVSDKSKRKVSISYGCMDTGTTTAKYTPEWLSGL